MVLGGGEELAEEEDRLHALAIDLIQRSGISLNVINHHSEAALL